MPLSLSKRASVFQCIRRSFLSAPFCSLVKECIDATKADELNFAVFFNCFKSWRPAHFSSWPEVKQAILLGPPLLHKQYICLATILYSEAVMAVRAHTTADVDSSSTIKTITTLSIIYCHTIMGSFRRPWKMIRRCAVGGNKFPSNRVRACIWYIFIPNKLAKDYSIVCLMCLSPINISFAPIPPAIRWFTAQERKEIIVVINKSSCLNYVRDLVGQAV